MKLSTSHPLLFAQWHPDNLHSLDRYSRGSNYKAKWRHWHHETLPGGRVWEGWHEWEQPIRRRVIDGAGCRLCSNRDVLEGYNDLLTLRPDLGDQWHPDNALTARQVTPGAGVKARWRHWHEAALPDGSLWAGWHEWVDTPNHRTSMNRGCAVCRGYQILVGHNDLATTRPQLVEEWDVVKNEGLTPNNVTAGSNKIAHWVCSQGGHSWSAPIDKRGIQKTGCPVCANLEIISGVNDLATVNPLLASEWHLSKNGDLSPNGISPATDRVNAWWVCSVNSDHEWQATVNGRAGGSGCPRCSRRISKSESALIEVVKLLCPSSTVLTSVRGVIPSGELDIYLPDEKIAVEFNGLYWHSEAAGKDRMYHVNKTRACAEQGIQLIHVWEDDWKRNQDIVVRALASRLAATHRLMQVGVLTEPDPSLVNRYGARTLKPKTISAQEASAFLFANHIQGPSRASLCAGLYDAQDVLRAVLAVTRVGNKGHEGEWRIDRYATRGVVPGGFTRLLSHAEKVIKTQNLGLLTSWVTFSDSALSDGGLYVNNGFVKDRVLPVDYMYYYQGVRQHKFGFRLKRFCLDPNLKYVEGATEKQLAEINNIPRIWDSGKVRWVKEVKSRNEKG